MLPEGQSSRFGKIIDSGFYHIAKQNIRQLHELSRPDKYLHLSCVKRAHHCKGTWVYDNPCHLAPQGHGTNNHDIYPSQTYDA
jgi:hypothetical protein